MSTRSLEIPGRSFRFIHSQFAKAVYPPQGISLTGQTGILTGGNIGLGFACAEWLLELDLSRLILAVRSPTKGEAAAKQLRLKSRATKIEVWQMDMASYTSIQQFADKCEGLDRVDFAILNAGVSNMDFVKSQEGHEEVYQTNYLSTVFLAHLLLPILKESSPPGKPSRLTIVNSGTSLMAKLPHRDETPFLPSFDIEQGWVGTEQYPASKALAHFWILKLVQRVRKEDVIVNLVDPGAVKGTGLTRHVSGIMSLAVTAAQGLVGRTLRSGASTFIDAVFVKGEESHGCFIHDWKIHP